MRIIAPSSTLMLLSDPNLGEPGDSVSALDVARFDFRHLFDDAPVGLVVVDAATSRMEYANAAARKMFGYEPEEVAGLLGARVTHPSDEPLSTELRKALADGYVDELHFEKRYVRKDGSVFWAEVSAVRRSHGPDHPVRFILCIIDISARKLAAKG